MRQETGFREFSMLGDRPDRGSEREAFRAAKEQALFDVAFQGQSEPRVDAELPDGRDAVAQAALGVPVSGASMTPCLIVAAGVVAWRPSADCCAAAI